jgi:hypothetical protein
MAIGIALGGAVALAPIATYGASAGSLRARAQAIESRLANTNEALQSNALAYLTEHAKYETARAAIASSRSRVKSIDRTVAFDRAVVRSAALTTYVEAGAVSPIGLYLDGKPDELAIGAEYARAANDNIATSISELNGEEADLSANLAVEQTQVTAAATALAETAASRTSVVEEFNSEHALLSSVNGQLAALVQEEEIAREQAAARAAAAAAAAAASSPTAGPPAVVGVAPVTLSAAVPSSLAAAFAAIRRCESSDDYSLDTGNGYYGAYQFAASTWTDLGEPGLANEASPATQDAAAYKLYQSSGWGAWPVCAAAAGL